MIIRHKNYLKSAKILIDCKTPIGHTLGNLFFLSLVSQHLPCAKIISPADVTDQTWTQSPVDSVVNQSGTDFQNFKNSQKIEEIMCNNNFFHQYDLEEKISRL